MYYLGTSVSVPAELGDLKDRMPGGGGKGTPEARVLPSSQMAKLILSLTKLRSVQKLLKGRQSQGHDVCVPSVLALRWKQPGP